MRGAAHLTRTQQSITEQNLAALKSLPEATIEAVIFSRMTYEQIKGSSVVTVTHSAKNPSAFERETPHDPRLGVVARLGTCEQCGMDTASCNGNHRGIIEFHTHLPPPDKETRSILKTLISIFCAGCGRITLSDAFLRGLKSEADSKKSSSSNNTDWHTYLIETIAKEASQALCHEKHDKATHKNGVAHSLRPKTEAFSLGSFVEGQVSREPNPPSIFYPLEFYYDAMNRLTPEQLYYLGFATKRGETYFVNSHPVALVLRAIPVMPLSPRSPVVGKNDSVNFHPITKAYNRTVDAASAILARKLELRALEQDKSRSNEEIIAKTRVDLQNRINHLQLVQIQNYEEEKNDLSNKETGLVRSIIQGKITEHIGRTGVKPDPRRRAGEVTIPRAYAEKITTVVEVTQANISELNAKLRSGQVKSIGPHNSAIHSILIQVTPQNRDVLTLQIGDKVHRYIEIGDALLFIRQPVIHGLSLLSCEVKEIWEEDVFGFSLEEVEIRAMDFDGDTAQGISPQSENAMAEMKSINSARQLLINPKDQALVFGFHQDAVLGSILMTANPLRQGDKDFADKGYVTRAMFDRITALVSTKCKGDISFEGLQLGISDKEEDFKRRLKKWGKVMELKVDGDTVVPTDVLLSWAFPADTQYITNTVEIRDGIVYRGTVGKSVLGRAQGTLLHFIAETDRDYAITVLKDVVVIATSYTSFSGISMGPKDCFTTTRERQRDIGLELARMMSRMATIPEPEDSRDTRRYQNELAGVIAESTGIIEKYTLEGFAPNNRVLTIINSGAKGSLKQAQVMNANGVIGQTFLGGEYPVPTMFGNTRTTPYHAQEETDPVAMGFCTSSWAWGVTPAEHIWIAATARRALMNLNIMTPDIGNKLNEANRVLAGIITNQEGACMDNDVIVSSLYGGDGLAGDRLVRLPQPTGRLELRFSQLSNYIDSRMARSGWYRKTE